MVSVQEIARLPSDSSDVPTPACPAQSNEMAPGKEYTGEFDLLGGDFHRS